MSVSGPFLAPTACPKGAPEATMPWFGCLFGPKCDDAKPHLRNAAARQGLGFMVALIAQLGFMISLIYHALSMKFEFIEMSIHRHRNFIRKV